MSCGNVCLGRTIVVNLTVIPIPSVMCFATVLESIEHEIGFVLGQPPGFGKVALWNCHEVEGSDSATFE